MSTDRTKLALRRQSIRILTSSDLRGVVAGKAGRGSSDCSGKDGTLVTTATTPTITSADLPQRSRTIA